MAPRFTAVADDDQSIYGWRGETIENLKRLTVHYPALKVIALEQNYRSTGAILRAANAVIANNPKLYEKKLWSEFGDGAPVALLECDNEEHEAERAVARIQSLRAAANPPPAWKNFAILYRANHQAKPFEKALRKANIPYKVSGGTSFFDRAEIRDLCAWFRLRINNDDDPAFLRAIGTTTRLGKVEDGTTTSDYDDEDHRRKISIYTSVIPVEHKNYKINFLDAPGYTDFVGEMVSALSVADGAIILVDAVAVIEVGTELAWRYATSSTCRASL